MHTPNPISLAAKASGEPEFREVGVGPWNETHPGEPLPTGAEYDPQLLAEGDRRNVLDRYRYWTVAAITADLDRRGRHDFEVAVENWTHDFNIGSMVRTANAFQARRVHIVGPHKWNRKGALMTELYQHVEYHPSIASLVEAWRLRIAGEIAAARAEAGAVALRMNGDGCGDGHGSAGVDTAVMDVTGASDASDMASEVLQTTGVAGLAGSGDVASDTRADAAARLAASDARIRELEAARVIALDIIPGAVPMETYTFPSRCLMLFGAEGPGLSRKALELADDVVYISQFGSVRSINAGAAAAVAMHAWIGQHAVRG